MKKRNLLQWGTFKIVLREYIPSDGNFCPIRLVVTIKSTDGSETEFKARFVIGGHRDRLNHMMMHSKSTL